MGLCWSVGTMLLLLAITAPLALFFVVALDHAIEYIPLKWKCPDWAEPVRQGNDSVVCQATADGEAQRITTA